MVAFAAVAAGHGIPIKSVRPSPVIINLTDRPLHSSGGVCVCCFCAALVRRRSCSPLVCTQSWQGARESGTNIQQPYILPPPPVGNNTLIYTVPPTDLEAPVPTFAAWISYADGSRLIEAVGDFCSSPPRSAETLAAAVVCGILCGIPRASEFAGEGTKTLAFVPVCFVFELDIWLYFRPHRRIREYWLGSITNNSRYLSFINGI